jgi:hypothetical protein
LKSKAIAGEGSFSYFFSRANDSHRITFFMLLLSA